MSEFAARDMRHEEHDCCSITRAKAFEESRRLVRMRMASEFERPRSEVAEEILGELEAELDKRAKEAKE